MDLWTYFPDLLNKLFKKLGYLIALPIVPIFTSIIDLGKTGCLLEVFNITGGITAMRIRIRITNIIKQKSVELLVSSSSKAKKVAARCSGLTGTDERKCLTQYSNELLDKISRKKQ